MKKVELREVPVMYCDYCGIELKRPYSSIKLDGKELDFCWQFDLKVSETCKSKYIKRHEQRQLIEYCLRRKSKPLAEYKIILTKMKFKKNSL